MEQPPAAAASAARARTSLCDRIPGPGIGSPRWCKGLEARAAGVAAPGPIDFASPVEVWAELRQEEQRVLREAVAADLEVKVRSRRVSRVAHLGDQLALLDEVPLAHQVPAVVS